MRPSGSGIVSVIVMLVLAAASVAQETRPSISYGGTRQSKAWIDVGNVSHAVDEGVAWKGVKVYLSLTWNLIAVDEATGKALWDQSVGAFWNEIGFAEIETASGVKTWAVELRPGRAGEGSALRQYHDLRTGKRIETPAAAPSGKEIEVKPQWSGRWSEVAGPIRRLVGSQEDFKTSVLDAMFAKPPPLGEIDFKKNVVLVYASGETWNCNGFEAQAWEDDRRILVRLEALTFQTRGPDGGGQKVRPYGIFVLPRRDPFKPVIVEKNTQNLIGAPAMWKEACRFDALGDAAPAPAKRQTLKK